MIKGLDLLCLGHRKFPLKDAIEVFPKGWALGAFVDVFGPEFYNVDEFLESGKPSLFRAQLHWDAGHNAHEAIIPIKKLMRYCASCEQLAKAFPKVEIFISHTCEYNCYNKTKVEKRLAIIKEYAPSCKIVQSCMEGYSSSKYPIEVHGNAHVWRDDFVSMDGVDITTINVDRWLHGNRTAYAAFGWRSEFNLRRKGQENPPLPKARPMILTKPLIQDVIRRMK